MYACTEWLGTGIIIENPWRVCDITGYVITPTVYSVKIPAGVKHGDILQIPDAGNAVPGPSYGSLFIKMSVEGTPAEFEF